MNSGIESEYIPNKNAIIYKQHLKIYQIWQIHEN